MQGQTIVFFRMIILISFSIFFLSVSAQTEGKLRIIAFGAHPDDAELKASGVAALWAAQGHKVKFVAMTNGDVGHFQSAGGPLAKRRLAEVQECARLLGIETEVLDIHDGELEPNLETRKQVARLIREWQADIVLFHRPYDYHPDHRYVGILVQDAAVVVVAPFFVPNTPPTKRNPVFLYYSDNFLKPYPFEPTIVVGIDAVAEKNGAVFLPCLLNSVMSIPGRPAHYLIFQKIPPGVRSNCWTCSNSAMWPWPINTGPAWLSSTAPIKETGSNMPKPSNCASMAGRPQLRN